MVSLEAQIYFIFLSPFRFVSLRVLSLVRRNEKKYVLSNKEDRFKPGPECIDQIKGCLFAWVWKELHFSLLLKKNRALLWCTEGTHHHYQHSSLSYNLISILGIRKITEVFHTSREFISDKEFPDWLLRRCEEGWMDLEKPASFPHNDSLDRYVKLYKSGEKKNRKSHWFSAEKHFCNVNRIVDRNSLLW